MDEGRRTVFSVLGFLLAAMMIAPGCGSDRAGGPAAEITSSAAARLDAALDAEDFDGVRAALGAGAGANSTLPSGDRPLPKAVTASERFDCETPAGGWRGPKPREGSRLPSANRALRSLEPADAGRDTAQGGRRPQQTVWTGAGDDTAGIGGCDPQQCRHRRADSGGCRPRRLEPRADIRVSRRLSSWASRGSNGAHDGRRGRQLRCGACPARPRGRPFVAQ